MQCWHGTPLKRLGCDLIHFDNQLNTLKGMKKRYKIEASKFTFFLSPSRFASEKFISAWNLKEIGKEIFDGNIDLKPYYKDGKTPCEYCEYKSICTFDPRRKENTYQYIHKLTKDDIMIKMKRKIKG